MSDINAVLERLVTDPDFRRQLREDPGKALQGYQVSDSEAEMLTSQLSEDASPGHGVEQRTSKSALGSFLGGLSEVAGTHGGTVPDHDAGSELGTEEVARNEADEPSYLKIEMKDVSVTSYGQDPAEGAPTDATSVPESAEAKDGTIVIEGKDISVKGTRAADTSDLAGTSAREEAGSEAGWDLQKNVKVSPPSPPGDLAVAGENEEAPVSTGWDLKRNEEASPPTAPEDLDSTPASEPRPAGGRPTEAKSGSRGVTEGIEGTDVSTSAYTSDDIGDDFPDDPPD